MSTITIDDVAQALGVSKTTVSRTISGKGRISEGTRARVQEYIQEHNYKPNAVAQSLAAQRTFNLGLVCPIEYEIFNLTYFHRCMLGISEVAAENGYDILLSMVNGDDVTNLRRIVENHKVDGVILTRSLVDDMCMKYLKESGIPFVVIGTCPDPEVVQVDNDHLGACSELTSILIAKGCRKLLLAGGEKQNIISQTRAKGFREAFRRARLKAEESWIYYDTEIRGLIPEILTRALQEHADGIICMDEKLAEAVLAQCREKEIRIPEDFKLASFYDSGFLAHSVPAVTAIDIDDTKLGFVAAQTLLKLIRGEPVQNQHLRNYQIILRESTT
ncbi:MAG: LacI family DNA-binding transcriptional regulator [Lachnospiraceae bacterium]|nr:LacI family DNA-binding transcriptional regulator [Lachnospiraceae bacterium]